MRNGDKFQATIASGLREAGLLRTRVWWLASLGIFLGLGYLYAVFLGEWEIEPSTWVWMLPLVTWLMPMDHWALVLLDVICHWPGFCFLLFLLYGLNRWEIYVCGALVIPGTLIRFYAWYATRWTTRGADFARHLYSVERREGRPPPPREVLNDVTAWDQLYYRQYCSEHGYATYGDGTSDFSSDSGGGCGGCDGCGSGGGGGGGGGW
jgi:uncharacterized membrane protein YgcG